MGMALKSGNASGAFNAVLSRYHCLIKLGVFIVKNHFKLQGSAKALCNYKMCVCISVKKLKYLVAHFTPTEIQCIRFHLGMEFNGQVLTPKIGAYFGHGDGHFIIIVLK